MFVHVDLPVRERERFPSRYMYSDRSRVIGDTLVRCACNGKIKTCVESTNTQHGNTNLAQPDVGTVYHVVWIPTSHNHVGTVYYVVWMFMHHSYLATSRTY